MPAILTLKDHDGSEINFIVEGGTASIMNDAQTKGASDPETEVGEVEKSFSEYFDPVRRLANQLATKISEIEQTPTEVEVSLGVKLTTEAGIVFAKAGADAEMTVKFIWKDSGK